MIIATGQRGRPIVDELLARLPQDRIGASEHRSAIAAAMAAGAHRIVYTSPMAASATSTFPPMRDHAAAEAMLAGCGIGWISLRNGLYAATVPRLVGDAARSGVLAAPAALADVAAVLSRQAGRAVMWRVIADEDYAAQLAGHGSPGPVIDIMLGLSRTSRAGEFEATDPTLERLLNRQPKAIADWLRP